MIGAFLMSNAFNSLVLVRTLRPLLGAKLWDSFGGKKVGAPLGVNFIIVIPLLKILVKMRILLS